MTSGTSCPFCGRSGPLTREHVWPRWLRHFPAYQRLVEQTSRLTPPAFAYPDLHRDGQGRLAEVSRERGRAIPLPEVTVKVCASCNNGWMARLESDVQTLLTPWIKEEPSQLTHAETARVSSWVAKTALTYALWHPVPRRPWPESVYRDFVASGEPPPNCLIWLAFSRDADCFISMDLRPLWWSFDAQVEDPSWILSGRPTVASFFVAAHGVVFFMHYWDGPPDAIDLFDLRGRLLGTAGAPDGLQRIWPPRSPARGPIAPLPQGRAGELRGTLASVTADVGLPVVGLRAEQLPEVRRRFQQGADPITLRRTFRAQEPL